jgi:hypothetical protein
MSEKRVFGDDEYKKLLKKKPYHFKDNDELVDPIDEDDNFTLIGNFPIEDPELAKKFSNALKQNPVKKGKKGTRKTKSRKSRSVGDLPITPPSIDEDGDIADEDIIDFLGDVEIGDEEGDEERDSFFF